MAHRFGDSARGEGDTFLKGGRMRLGAHMSISGGIEKAVVRGQEVGCEALQIFTKNSNQWKAMPLTSTEVTAFRDACQAAGIGPVIAHSAYLINLAAADEALYEKSIQAFLDELQRCELLGIPYLVVHPGAHMGAGEEQGLRRISIAIDRIHRETQRLYPHRHLVEGPLFCMAA